MALVVVRLLTDRTITDTISVGRPPGLAGPDLAAAFSTHLHRGVRFEAITPYHFGEHITPILGEAAASPVSLYRALSMQEGNAISENNSAQAVLGVSPRSLSQWLVDLEV